MFKKLENVYRVSSCSYLAVYVLRCVVDNVKIIVVLYRPVNPFLQVLQNVMHVNDVILIGVIS